MLPDRDRSPISSGIFEEAPIHLYKYRSMNSEGIDALFLKNQIYLPSPEKFNDPFDCYPTVDASMNITQKRLFLKRDLALRGVKLSRNELRSVSRDAARTIDGTSTVSFMDAAFLAVNRTGIFSMSEIPDQILMWSHYAKDHTGFCVRFRTELDLLLGTARKVTYQQERPVMVLREHPDSWVEKAILIKSHWWEYEREWRAIRAHQPGLHTLTNGTIDGVILGAKMAETDEAKIRDLASRSPSKIQMMKASLAVREFALDITVTAPTLS